MAVVAEQSSEMEAGFARLRLSNLQDLDPGTLEIGISTADAGKHLDPSEEGAAAWTSGERWFTPDKSLLANKELVLEIGPSVTWHLKPNQPYLVSFRDGHEHRTRDRMIWIALRLPSNPPIPAPMQLKLAPEREVEPEPADEIAPDEATPDEAALPSPPPARKKPRGIWWIVLLAAGLILAAALWFFKDDLFGGNVLPLPDAEEEAPSDAEEEAPSDAGEEALSDAEEEALSDAEEEAPSDAEEEAPSDAEEEAPSDAEEEAPSDAEEEAPSDAEEEAPSDAEEEALSDAEEEALSDAETATPLTLEAARAFLREQPSSDAAFEEAQRFSAADQQQTAFLLFKYAARKGSARAARHMGGFYDPATYASESGVISEPDPVTAADWYERAAKAGDVAAMVRLGEMLKEGMLDRPDASEQSLLWLRKAAEAGNERAKELLE